MVNIDNKEHFKEALNFSKTLGGKSKKSFYQCLRLLNRIKKNGCKGMNLYIYPDFVKHSFNFCFMNETTKKRGLTGGMILHGFQETFSVQLVSKNYPSWSLHT